MPEGLIYKPSSCWLSAERAQCCCGGYVQQRQQRRGTVCLALSCETDVSWISLL